MRLIDADNLKIPNDAPYKASVKRVVAQQQTVDAVPVVHGEWVNEYINRYGHPCHCCSVCGFHASHQDKNFCPCTSAETPQRR